MEFEWDSSKEIENLRKYDVSFSEAVETFLDPDGFIMKQPKLENLEINQSATDEIRRQMAKKKGSVKITINIDADSLITLRKLATETGIPYQRLLNQLLRQGLDKKTPLDSRLHKIEKEISRIKQRLAA